MKVHWTDRAKERLWKIHEHISQDNSIVARQVVRQLLLRSRKLKQFPRRGRKVPEYQLEDVRELLESSHRIIHYIRTDRIDVISVMHTRQLLPTDIQDILGSPSAEDR